jgi:hypothetical protein
MEKLLASFKVSLIVAILAFFPACATLNSAESEISVSTPAGLTIGVSVSVESSDDDDDESDDDKEGQGLRSNLLSVLGMTPSLSTASDFQIVLSGSNANIPDQTAPFSITVRSGGMIVGASTFNAQINSGVLSASNPSAINNWLSRYDHLDEATIDISANGLDIDLPSGGSYQVTNEFWTENQLLASSTTSGYVSPGGGGGYTDPY